eukprot:UN0461
MQGTLAWLDKNQAADRDECWTKQKELEDVVNPIILQIRRDRVSASSVALTGCVAEPACTSPSPLFPGGGASGIIGGFAEPICTLPASSFPGESPSALNPGTAEPILTLPSPSSGLQPLTLLLKKALASFTNYEACLRELVANPLLEGIPDLARVP